MPPPSDFELLRGKDARRGVSGETKHELLARASLERQVRADARRKKHGALTVQRIWRGRRVAASVRASVLASWDLEYGSSRVTPSLIELLDKLLPPLLMVGAQNAGAQRTLRGLALALGTCNAEMGTTDGRQKVQHWTQRARRLSAFALDVLCTASRTSAEDPCVASLANASRECAVRLLTALHGDGVLVRLDDPLGSKHHLTMCDVAASLAREGDRANAQSLVRITLNTMDTWEPAEPTETSDCTPLGLRHVALRFVAAVPSLHKAVDVHVFAKVMSSRAKVKAFLKAFYMGTEESAVPGTESTRSSDLSSHFDPVTAADNLVWLVTGWHVGCNGHTQITQARQKLVALDDETLVVFLEVLTSLTQTSNTASTPNSLREVWFVMGVFREGNEPAIDALAKLFWAAASTGTSSSSIDHNKDRRRILGAVAFAPGVLLQMWRRLAVRLPVAVSISDSPGGADGSGLWCSPTLALGAVSVSATDVPLLGLFSLAYGHLLSVLDDDEFFKTQNTFTLHTQIAIAACANTLVVRERLRRSSAGTRGSSSATQNHDHARLTAAVVSLLKGLVTRDARRKFTPPKFWLAPADATQIDKQRVTREIMKPLPPEAAASALMGLEATTRSGKQSSATNGTGGYTNFLADCPHALPFETRVKIFRLLVNADRAHLKIGAQSGGVDADRTNQGQRVVPVAKITIRRGFVLEDALAQILPLGSAAKGRLQVSFVNSAGEQEAGIDAGGLFKELLSVVLEKALDPNRGLFLSTTNRDRDGGGAVGGNTCYPNPSTGDSSEHLALLTLSGVLMGKAMYEGILVSEFKLSDFFVKKLLGEHLSLDDLPSLDFDTHRAISQILTYSRQPRHDVADLSLDWFVREEVFGEIVSRNLRPGEKTEDDVVEQHDVLSYCLAVAEHHLIKRRKVCDEAFFDGVRAILNPRWLRLFNSSELTRLTCGEHDETFDVEDMRKHTLLQGGYDEGSKTIKMFWNVVRELSPENKKKFLRFVTSSSSPPVQGFAHLHPPFTVYKVRCGPDVVGGTSLVGGGGFFAATLIGLGMAKDVQRLPTASTCFNTLKLPNFKTAQGMREKLLTAINSGAGFELS